MRYGSNPRLRKLARLKEIKQKEKERVERKYTTINNKIGGFDYNIRVSKKDYERMIHLQKRVEKKRNEMLKKINPHVAKGAEITRGQQLVKFVPAKPADISKFTSVKGFYRHLEALKQYDKGNFLKNRSEVYRDNMVNAIKKVYNNMGDGLVEKIKELNTDELQYLLIRHPSDFSISYVYFGSVLDKLNELTHLEKLVDDVIEKNIKIFGV